MKQGLLCLFFIGLLVLPASCFAQGSSNTDILYLRNGSILYGKIIEQADTQKTGIEIIGNNLLVFNTSDIEKIEKNPSSHHTLPIESSTTCNFYGGSNGSAGFHVNGSYRFSFGTGAGVGCGVDFFSYQVMPVYAEVSQLLLKGRFKPYIYGQAGYSIPLTKYNLQNPYGYYYDNTDLKGGILLAAGGGIRTEISPRFSLLFSVGYRYQRLRQVTDLNQYYYEGSTSILERIDHLNRIQVALGIQFK
jgi:hypothetical protein